MRKDGRKCFLIHFDNNEQMGCGPFEDRFAALQFRDLMYPPGTDLTSEPFQIIHFIEPDWGATKEAAIMGCDE